MSEELLASVEAVVIKLEPGDILVMRLPEDVLTDTEAIAGMVEAIKHALDHTGHTEDVGVLLTADAIQLEVVRVAS